MKPLRIACITAGMICMRINSDARVTCPPHRPLTECKRQIRRWPPDTTVI